MTRHPDAGVLAEFRAGLLRRRRSARVRAHLAGCPRCASLDAGLAEVSELLASSPAPSMPDHLAARLDAALAAEAARRPRVPQAAAGGADAARTGVGGDGAARPADGAAPRPDGQAGSPSGHRGHPARSRRLARGRPAVLGAAAAVIIAVAGIAYGVASLPHPQGGGSASSRGGAGQRAPSGPPSGGQNAPALSPANILPRGIPHVIHSGTDYQPGTLARQAAAVLSRHQAPHSGQTQETTQGMRGCVRLVTGGGTYLLVDVARYRGRPATIIMQAPSAGQPGRVWVAGPGCSAQHRDLLAQATLPGSG